MIDPMPEGMLTQEVLAKANEARADIERAVRECMAEAGTLPADMARADMLVRNVALLSIQKVIIEATREQMMDIATEMRSLQEGHDGDCS